MSASQSLHFSHRWSYASETAIAVPITLIASVDENVDLMVEVDTGSTFCVFQRHVADWLGLNIKSGMPVRVRTATGAFAAYGHELVVSVLDLEWQTVVYFAEEEWFPVSVVGRVGFLDRLQVGIVDYEQLLYLGLYDE